MNRWFSRAFAVLLVAALLLGIASDARAQVDETFGVPTPPAEAGSDAAKLDVLAQWYIAGAPRALVGQPRMAPARLAWNRQMLAAFAALDPNAIDPNRYVDWMLATHALAAPLAEFDEERPHAHDPRWPLPSLRQIRRGGSAGRRRRWRRQGLIPNAGLTPNHHSHPSLSPHGATGTLRVAGLLSGWRIPWAAATRNCLGRSALATAW